jgi:zinc protease
MTLLRRCLLALLLIVGTPALAAGDADWLYRGSDIQRDPAWSFGTLPNGVRYAVRRNAVPQGQVSVRVRIAAGSFHETESERGFAHFVEHMTFRGTRAFGDGDGRRIWQQLGASFGSDSNASTTPTQTVYQLDLPKNDPASLDRAINVLSEMVDTALFDPATVEAEKRVILAEKGRRPELTQRMIEASWPLFYAGLRIRDRDTIGTDATLRAARAEALRAFYEHWYRPDRATVIMVGDADPAVMEQLIVRHFGTWQATGPAPAEPDYGRIAEPKEKVATLAYPGAPHSATLMWLRPYELTPNTKAQERVDLARSLAARILNRRLEAKARNGANYVSAGVGENRATNIADTTQLSLTAREGKWQEGLADSFAIIADALRAPPSEAEIARELANLKTAAASGVEAESTVRSPVRAQQLVNAVDKSSVVASAAVVQAIIEELGPQMTPAAVGAAMRDLFAGAGPRMALLAPTPVQPSAAARALAAAAQAKPAERLADRSVSFDVLPKLGPPGSEVARERIADMDATIVRFANGATLTFKRTQFEKGQVGVQVRFGNGLVGLPADRPSLAWLGGLVGPSGLADLDLDGMERLMTGRRLGLSFGVGEDAFQLAGATSGQDLQDQLRLLATKLAYPRWDAPLFQRFKTGALSTYDLAFSSASARAGRETNGFLRGGDPRWAPVERNVIAAAQPADLQGYFTPLLASGPLDVIIVGDVDLETAVKAVRETIASLPARQASPVPAASRAVRPPDPSPKARVFTHQGDPSQAYAAIGWTTFGGTERVFERRALSLAANMLQVRLFDRLREAEGASYSPSAASASSEELPDWGIFTAAAEIRPESADTFFRIAREIVTDLAAKPAAADEFQRAQNPVLTGIDRRLRTNAYWISAMEEWAREPEKVELTRTFLADYRRMTPEDVRAAVARYVADAGDWSMLVLPAKQAGGGK